MTSRKDKLIYAKTKLLEKFKRAVPRKEGTLGNRERLPPGQHVTGFQVLDLGVHPPFDPAIWRFRVEGEVENPINLGWGEFRALAKAQQVSDFHCVTTWSTYDLALSGVKFSTILELVRPTARATHVIQESADDYTTNLPLAELIREDVLLAYEIDGEPLPVEHGGPMRMIVPHLYGWKSAKFLTRLIFQDHDTPGFWEVRGYHSRGDPWKEERYG